MEGHNLMAAASVGVSAGITPTMSIGHKGAVVGAKAIAASVLDLVKSPQLLAAAKKQFEEDTRNLDIFHCCRRAPNRRLT
jgi:aminobenzoyl-glutamate utilization protein B